MTHQHVLTLVDASTRDANKYADRLVNVSGLISMAPSAEIAEHAILVAREQYRIIFEAYQADFFAGADYQNPVARKSAITEVLAILRSRPMTLTVDNAIADIVADWLEAFLKKGSTNAP